MEPHRANLESLTFCHGKPFSDIPAVLSHSVVFKCISASKDKNSQVTWSLTSRDINDRKEVEVKLKCEENIVKLKENGEGLGM